MKGVPGGNFRGLKIKKSGKCHELSRKSIYLFNAQPTTPTHQGLAHCWFLVGAMLAHGWHNLLLWLAVNVGATLFHEQINEEAAGKSAGPPGQHPRPERRSEGPRP